MSSSSYGWLITRDYLAEKYGPGTDVGVSGPFGLSDELLARLKAGEGDKFEMLDDDGNLYYEGLLIGGEDGFEPLDDFGAPNAGCTEIRINGESL